MSSQQTDRDVYRLIARMKGTDACIQAACFLATIGMFSYISFKGILIFAGAQYFSAVFWLFVLRGDTIRMRGGVAIRIAFIIMVLFLAGSFWLGNILLLYIAAFVTAIAGSLCCILYGAVTLMELSFYRKLAGRNTGKKQSRDLS